MHSGEASYILLKVILSFEHFFLSYGTTASYAGGLIAHHDPTCQKSEAGTQGPAVSGTFAPNALRLADLFLFFHHFY